MTHPEIVTKAREVFGRYIRDVQEASPYNVEELARRAGISKRTLYDIFQGKGYTIDSFIRVLAALDLRLEIMPKMIEPEQSN